MNPRKSTTRYQRWMRRKRKAEIKHNRLSELHAVESGLARFGRVKEVDPVVARWFRLRGCEVHFHRSGMHAVVVLPE